MESTPRPLSAQLPFQRRLRRAVLVALLLGLWAPVKVGWEQEIARQQDFLRYKGAPISRALTDQLGQGLTIGVLGGLRSVVADFVWIRATIDWQNEDWFDMMACIKICTTLEPRAPVFPTMGGWDLAWNASIVGAEQDITQSDPMKRLKASRFWIDRGLEVFKRGIENNPGYWRLWYYAGLCYDQRLKDYDNAAYYYQKASEVPGAPIYIERFSAIMFDRQHGKDPEKAYPRWKALWEKLTPEERTQKIHEPDRIEKEIRELEEKLSIPKEKRVFPN
jgi:tetratricopeptide (TPR) repeat protein